MPFLEHIDGLILLVLFCCGALAFGISTVSGGGGALILVPALNSLLGVNNTATVLNLGSFIGRPSRLVLFWKHINWPICLYYAPAAILSAWLAAYLFSALNVSFLQLFIGLFLISTLFQFRFGKEKKSFTMKRIYFIPLGIIVSFLGTIVGALGPVLNPFYLNYGLDKEELIATKTANSFLMGLSQISSYAFFGLLHNEYWIYGISLGLGATLGNIIGKQFLKKMKSTTFRKILIGFMILSGVLLVFKQVKVLFL